MQAYSYESCQIQISPLIEMNTRNVIVLMIGWGKEIIMKKCLLFSPSRIFCQKFPM